MSTIRIITGADKKYSLLADTLEKEALSFGYEVKMFDYGGYKGEKAPVLFPQTHEIDVYKAKIPSKPDIVLKGLKGNSIYLDCDCRILKKLDVKFDFDLAFTVREPKYQDGKILGHKFPHITGYLNAGVIFLKESDKVRDFLKYWKEELPFTETGSDQEALTNILRRHITDWSYGLKDVMGLKVRLLPMTYNSENKEENAKIVHYCGTYEDKIKYYK